MAWLDVFVVRDNHLFMDNYYNSVSLAHELYDNGIHCNGTLHLVRAAPRVLKWPTGRKGTCS